jgi:hypothetical protein
MLTVRGVMFCLTCPLEDLFFFVDFED